MEICYRRPSVHPEFKLLIERIHPPRVCIDNDAFPDCTLVKVDSANKHGILLEMVQVLTDLDLVISKSYISSDGGWLMDVFHVTDQSGNKIIEESIIHYITQALCESRRGIQSLKRGDVGPRFVFTEQTTALEMTGTDRPGLMSEISAVLAEMGCHITGAVAWTHNARAACILYVEEGEDDDAKRGPIRDPYRVAQIQAQLENVVEAHHQNGQRRSVRISDPGAMHAERRLHQLMAADGDFEQCGPRNEGGGARVKIENCKEKGGYSIVTVWCRDRPKLLFDTVCALTDMRYVVSHASISSQDSMSVQEYYLRHEDGCTLNLESERNRVTQCLIAATERRASHGLRLDIRTRNRRGLLSDVTRVFRENGLSISRAEIGTRGESAIGTFYVKDASGQSIVSKETVESVRREIGSTAMVVHESSGWFAPAAAINREEVDKATGGGGISLGSLLWAQLERISSNFRPIRS
ncbi:unnamed protein product [Cuscuta campestris]|uniref:ACT domain-containing protein ACR n=2 Tax=Cuscuta sect. Cleistogrammica TaxID=1824901 RepID=A0A484NJK6_9ASTE|nr:hypothetical protein DM860_004939 [Cuscuta australis]VFR00005.1 unnamed protein product [Cuscuta campestris]